MSFSGMPFPRGTKNFLGELAAACLALRGINFGYCALSFNVSFKDIGKFKN